MEGYLEGGIINEFRGQNGFGYDPVFIVKEEGKTMAELSDEEKDRYSHRGKASHHLITLLGEIS